MSDPEVYDVVVIGAGIAGLRSANELAKHNISFHMVDGSDHIGGRIVTHSVHESPHMPPYKFEEGAAFIHGVKDSPLYSLFQTLYEKYHPESRFADILSPVFEGNFWVHPEFIQYTDTCYVDGMLLRRLTEVEYHTYRVLVVLHLRPLLRSASDIDLRIFAPLYCKFVEQLAIPNSDVIARAVAWYFHSVECYNGVGIASMVSSDIFHCQDTCLQLPQDGGDGTDGDVGDDESSKAAAYLLFLSPESAKHAVDLIAATTLDDLVSTTQAYVDSDLARLDAQTQGCGLSSHCIVNPGMSTLVELLEHDTRVLLSQRHQQSEHVGVDGDVSMDMASPPSPLAALPLSLNTRVVCVDIGVGVGLEGAPDPTDGPPPAFPRASPCVVHTNTGRAIHSRYGVICTASLLSLKHTPLFDPSTQAFTSLCRLHDTAHPVFYKKVVFGFDTPWWPENSRILAISQADLAVGCEAVGVGCDIASPLYDGLLKAIQDGPIDGDAHHTVKGCNVFVESHLPTKGTPVLSCSIVGALAELVGSVDDRAVANLVLLHLRRIYMALHQPCAPTSSKLDDKDGDRGGDVHESQTPRTKTVTPAMPPPAWTRITHWGDVEDVYQSYTLVVDCDDDVASRVSSAERDGVWFAGEAIDAENAGSVHAALETGYLAAQRVLSVISKVNPSPTVR